MGDMLISLVICVVLCSQRYIPGALLLCIKVPWLPRSVFNHISDGLDAASSYSNSND